MHISSVHGYRPGSEDDGLVTISGKKPSPICFDILTVDHVEARYNLLNPIEYRSSIRRWHIRHQHDNRLDGILRNIGLGKQGI
jgi:hypothetical protein